MRIVEWKEQSQRSDIILRLQYDHLHFRDSSCARAFGLILPIVAAIRLTERLHSQSLKLASDLEG